MMRAHAFKSREEVVGHLTQAGGSHGWEDPKGDGWNSESTASQLRDMDGRPIIATAEYLAIHRELHLLEPCLVVSAEQGTDPRQWW